MTLDTIPLVFALAMTVIYTVLMFVFTQNTRLTIANIPLTFLPFYFITKLYIWAAMPAMIGAFGGWNFLIFDWFLCMIPYAIAIGIATMALAKRDRYGEMAMDDWAGLVANTVFGVLAFFGVWGLLLNGIGNIGATWGDDNMHRYVQAAHITVAGKQMPPSDPSHIVLVSQDIAAYLGQNVLASTGQNLGSRFHFEHDQYTLQSVRVNGQNNLYWIAPMTYNNAQQQMGQYDSPGYVMVDAENPNTSPILVEKDLTGKTVGFHYIPGLFGDRDLSRHVYQQGYNRCNLLDPTVEVDDNLRPWYTILCADSFNGYEGFTMKSVLLVDPLTGNVTAYAPGKQPSWVDRVVPQATSSDGPTDGTAEWWVDHWARYKSAPWNDLGTGGAGEMKRDGGTEILYNFTNGSDKPAYLMPITSNNGSDTTSTGFILYDTNNLQGTFYPLAGIQIGDPVRNVFANYSQNLQHYNVSGIRLYSLYGVPTWEAIYEQPNSAGASFQAVGFVDARNLNGNNVVWGKTLDEALANYQNMLATEGNNSQVGTNTSNGKTLTGTIQRLVSQSSQTVTTYTMIISGSAHVFVVESSLPSAKYLNVAQVGDKVTIQYNDTGAQVATILNFDDLTVEQLIQNNATASPTPAHP